MSTKWLDFFPDCIQRVLAQPVSNHSPLLLETGMEEGLPFKFEIMWLSKKGFLMLLKIGGLLILLRGWMGYQLAQKLKFLKNEMKDGSVKK